MKKKIALIEPMKHYEVLASMLRMFADEVIEVHCFTTAFCHSQIGDVASDVEFYLSKGEHISDDFLLMHLDIINTCDWIFFTTLDFNSSFLLDKNLKAKTAALIHNSNNFFFPDKGKVVDLPKYYFNKLRGDFTKAKQTFDQLDRVVVPTQSIADQVRKNLKQGQEKVQAIEIAFPQFKTRIHDRAEVIITIPGTVNQDRRDYQLIAKIIPKVEAQIDRPVKLVFLGKVFSKREKAILDQLKSQPLKYFKIVTFENYVSISDFKNQLLATDFLLLPIQQMITYKSLREERGKTCISGNINDMVQFALPALLPNFYPLAEQLQPLVEAYNNEEELTNLLVKWIKERKYDQKKINLDVVLAEYRSKCCGEFIRRIFF